MWKLKSWFVSEWRLCLEFNSLQQILDYPATEYHGSLCKEGRLRPLCLFPWGKINFTCCVQGKLNSPNSPPKGAKDADVLTCDSDSSNCPWSASASCCLSVLCVGVIRTISLSPCTVSFHSHFSGLFSWLLPWVCYGMRSMCALIMGKMQACLDFYPLGPKSSLSSTQVSALN